MIAFVFWIALCCLVVLVGIAWLCFQLFKGVIWLLLTLLEVIFGGKRPLDAGSK